MKERPKLTINEQINDMKKRGIKFNITDENEAKEYLEHNNYYFKLKVYSKLYEKDENGNYCNLEFAYLVELSKIDMYLRRFILRLTLDIEHFLKVKLLNDIAKNEKEDGYSIIKDLFNCRPQIEDDIENKSKNSICTELVNTFNDQMAIWNIVEILSFGDFINLYDLYYSKYKDSDSCNKMLYSVKQLRNIGAHNNCLIHTLKLEAFNHNKSINRRVNEFVVKKVKISEKTTNKKLQNIQVHDLIVSLFVFNEVVCSQNVKKHFFSEFSDFLENRALENKNYFSGNAIIASNYDFLKKVVDKFKEL